jgi:hypothetical protein
MIQYETSTSPFFVANKNYCETIENKLKTLNVEFSGFCNSFGYHIETTFQKNNLTYNLKFHKHQSTQNGVIIPIDALEYAGTEVNVTGLNKKFRVTIGKSSLRRLFTSKLFKNKIQKPYFIKFNYSQESDFLDNLTKKIIKDKISKFKLSNGTLICKIHKATVNPLELITDIEKMTKKWT